MIKPILIGLHGKPRSGKDTLANYLIKKYSLLRYGPSVPVKNTAAAMFDVPRHYFDDDKMKDQVDPFWKITYRQMAQKVGKESSRDVFGDDIWLRHVQKLLIHIADSPPDVDQYSGIILADIRYANEAEWVQQMGGTVIFIVRDNLPESSGTDHPAEAGLSLDLADIVVYNNSTINDMYIDVERKFDGCNLMEQYSCCSNERRNFNGGCDNCGDPCL